MKQIKFLLLIHSFFLSFSLTAQNSNLDKSLAKVDEFLKKLDAKINPSNSKPQSTNTKSSSLPSGEVPKATSRKGNGFNPGDISPNAKYLDVDVLEPFSGGAAIVRKGTSTALIDTGGNFIVPFNKYTFLSLLNPQEFGSGFFLTSEGDVLNAKGHVIARAADYKSTAFALTSDGKYCFTNYPNNKTVYIDLAGNKYTTSVLANNVNDGIGVVGRRGFNGGGEKFFKHNNKRITSKNFNAIEPFSEGMAVVSILDDFGKVRYGFINTKGIEVIPPKFTNPPTNFKYGYSVVKPTDISEFQSAFINKKGEIVFKQTIEHAQKYGAFTEFSNGYIYSSNSKYMMDTSLKIFTQEEFLNSFGTNSQTYSILGFINSNYKVEDGKLRIEKKSNLLYDRKTNSYSPNNIGFLDLKRKKIIEAAFCNYGTSTFGYLFDPVSKFAYAERVFGYDKNGIPILKKGYINEEGVFVILIGKTDKW